LKKYGLSFRKLHLTGVAMLTAPLHLQSSDVLEEQAETIAIEIKERTKMVLVLFLRPHAVTVTLIYIALFFMV
jgi:hypothetical protein